MPQVGNRRCKKRGRGTRRSRVFQAETMSPDLEVRPSKFPQIPDHRQPLVRQAFWTGFGSTAANSAQATWSISARFSPHCRTTAPEPPAKTSPSAPSADCARCANAHRFSWPTRRRPCAQASGKRLEYPPRIQCTGWRTNGASHDA